MKLSVSKGETKMNDLGPAFWVSLLLILQLYSERRSVKSWKNGQKSTKKSWKNGQIIVYLPWKNGQNASV